MNNDTRNKYNDEENKKPTTPVAKLGNELGMNKVMNSSSNCSPSS